jgi:beta-N-acetylhexosaminidase
MRLAGDRRARRRLAALGAAAALALAIGLAIGAAGDGGGDPASPGEDGDRSDRAPASDARGDPVDRLSLRQQVGQLLISSFDGPAPPPYMRRRLRAGETAGVILFGRNVSSEGGVRELTAALQRAARGGALVAADQEGGQIRTLQFAGPEAAQPQQGGPAQVEQLARQAARQLRAAGVNVNLAPVADVPSGPAALAGRSFAGTAEQVDRSVRASVRGMRAGRVAATAKHFPGLGAAPANTDDVPVTIEASRKDLEGRDLPPFRAAVEERVPLVMASHALYPALDPRRIASQSAPVMDGLLREELGFRGVAVTDSIEAEAVLARSGVAEAGERAVAAGVDLVLLTGSGSWNQVFPRLLGRARGSPSFRRQVRTSAARVLELKRELGLRANVR